MVKSIVPNGTAEKSAKLTMAEVCFCVFSTLTGFEGGPRYEPDAGRGAAAYQSDRVFTL